ncbi:MAG: hypothetical protein AAGI38_14130, partial [Bacteroidota bacterium]
MKKIILSLLSVLLVVGVANAQYYYVPNINAGENPGNLNNDGEFAVGSGLDPSWTTILPGGNSTPTWSSIQSIPFPFNFEGSPVTEYKVSSTGVLTFTTSATAVPGPVAASLPSPNIPDQSVVIWGINGTGSDDNVVTKTFGTSPNRQHWVFFSSFSKRNTVTFWSIVLEETTNNIHIVDQRHLSLVTGLSLGVQSDINNAVQVTGSPRVAALAEQDSTPVDNSYYTFINGTQPTVDLSVTSFSNSEILLLSNSPFIISGEVSNFGTAAVSSFDINYQVNNGNVITRTLNQNIPSYGTSDFSHPVPWNPASTGLYT